jgi:hypothetical protein
MLEKLTAILTFDNINNSIFLIKNLIVLFGAIYHFKYIKNITKNKLTLKTENLAKYRLKKLRGNK